MKQENLHEFKYLYPGVQRTDDLLTTLQCSNTRTPFSPNYTKSYQPLHDRYFKSKVSAKNQLAAIFAAKVQDMTNVPKHVKVRRNPVEKAKLDYLEQEMSNSPRLREVFNETA